MIKAERFIKGLILSACGVIIFGIYGNAAKSECFAADTQTQNKEKSEEELYKLDDEVKEWLDAGNSIPGDAKFATLSATSHLWKIDSTDISDGRVELTTDTESRTIYGIALKDWLKTQYFYGDNFGSDDNRKKFIRPQKSVAF